MAATSPQGVDQQNKLPFHLAFPVRDLASTRQFYEGVLGCKVGRASDRWIDFDFWGNQITAHLTGESASQPGHNPVDGHDVPIRHFGVILEWEDWEQLVLKLREHGVEFLIEPYVRFEGEVGEQATLFFFDPSGNAIEFKSFRDFGQMFAT